MTKSDERERAIRRVAERLFRPFDAGNTRRVVRLSDFEATLGEIWDAAQAQYAADRLRPAIVDEWEDEARARGLLHDTAARPEAAPSLDDIASIIYRMTRQPSYAESREVAAYIIGKYNLILKEAL